MTSILEFYNGKPLKLKNGEELTLQQILLKDNSWWDGCHDFIQWIFPTRTVSQYCFDAPILTEKIARELAKKHLAQFQLNILRFGEFLDSQDMITMNHNHLRITRMIECSSLVTNSVKSDPDLFFLMEIIRKYIPLTKYRINSVLEGNSVGLHLCPHTAKYWFEAFYSTW